MEVLQNCFFGVVFFVSLMYGCMTCVVVLFSSRGEIRVGSFCEFAKQHNFGLFKDELFSVVYHWVVARVTVEVKAIDVGFRGSNG